MNKMKRHQDNRMKTFGKMADGKQHISFGYEGNNYHDESP